MISLGSFTRAALACCCAAALCGCFPSGQSQQDEEKEPHFLAGRARSNSMDYTRAIESFEKALEVNPRSASAHFELGCLFADKEPDPAAAIYHYEQYLKLRPGSDKEEMLKQHIFRLKQDLAKAILPLPATPGLQHEFENLAAENRQLRDEVDRWRTYYAGSGAVRTNTPVVAAAVARAVPASNSIPAAALAVAPQTLAGPGRVTGGAPGSARTHTVKTGDNPTSIARKYGVTLGALQASNPNLDPRKLKVGQTLNIPSP